MASMEDFMVIREEWPPLSSSQALSCMKSERVVESRQPALPSGFHTTYTEQELAAGTAQKKNVVVRQYGTIVVNPTFFTSKYVYIHLIILICSLNLSLLVAQVDCKTNFLPHCYY